MGRDRPSNSITIPSDIAQDAQRDMERRRQEDRINQEAAEGSRRHAISISPAASTAPIAATPHSALKCRSCGRLGHSRKSHMDCPMNRRYLLIVAPIAPAALTVPATPAAPTVPAAAAIAAIAAIPAIPAISAIPVIPFIPVIPVIPVIPIAPAAPTAPATFAIPIIPAIPAAPAAPAAAPAVPDAPAVRVFGNGMASCKEQDDTEYKTLDRMNVVCSHCGALHWREVTI